MSEQSDGGVVERQGRKRGRAALTELVLIVRPPGTPTAIRVRMYNLKIAKRGDTAYLGGGKSGSRAYGGCSKRLKRSRQGHMGGEVKQRNVVAGWNELEIEECTVAPQGRG